MRRLERQESHLDSVPLYHRSYQHRPSTKEIPTIEIDKIRLSRRAGQRTGRENFDPQGRNTRTISTVHPVLETATGQASNAQFHCITGTVSARYMKDWKQLRTGQEQEQEGSVPLYHRGYQHGPSTTVQDRGQAAKISTLRVGNFELEKIR